MHRYTSFFHANKHIVVSMDDTKNFVQKIKISVISEINRKRAQYFNVYIKKKAIKGFIDEIVH